MSAPDKTADEVFMREMLRIAAVILDPPLIGVDIADISEVPAAFVHNWEA